MKRFKRSDTTRLLTVRAIRNSHLSKMPLTRRSLAITVKSLLTSTDVLLAIDQNHYQYLRHLSEELKVYYGKAFDWKLWVDDPDLVVKDTDHEMRTYFLKHMSTELVEVNNIANILINSTQISDEERLKLKRLIQSMNDLFEERPELKSLLNSSPGSGSSSGVE